MRAFLAVLLLSTMLPGCTPYIPVKDDFGTTALLPAAGIPPEFAAFNNYDQGVNPLLAQQLCATSYQPLENQNVGAAPGRFDQAIGRCQIHTPLFGP
jgi:hypothetical protein